nr:uncharacterized protein LOC129384011 [Dermacentor andersoni]
MYLVEGVCFYTKEQFKNHKMSDAYNAFLSGKVKRVMAVQGRQAQSRRHPLNCICGAQPAALENIPTVVRRQRRRLCCKRSLHVHSRAAPVSEINFFKAKPGQQVPEPAPRQQGSIPTWNFDQMHSFLEHVKTFAPSTLVLSCVTDSEVRILLPRLLQKKGSPTTSTVHRNQQ